MTSVFSQLHPPLLAPPFCKLNLTIVHTDFLIFTMEFIPRLMLEDLSYICTFFVLVLLCAEPVYWDLNAYNLRDDHFVLNN